ncbi:hypothetical protein MUK42_37002 [Musa troglodytarum]|uniref:Uncharacterized protein n=1 Tax=Musa troglodytarum TaxID=320322 RepID=A0A9E7EG77_9LILI|nr:hypothetical protein MUK42_37002 [Musa troglodytarum]
MSRLRFAPERKNKPQGEIRSPFPSILPCPFSNPPLIPALGFGRGSAVAFGIRVLDARRGPAAFKGLDGLVADLFKSDRGRYTYI